jgi:TonB family protein
MFGFVDPVDSQELRAASAMAARIEARIEKARASEDQGGSPGAVLGLLAPADDRARGDRRAEAARIEARIAKVKESDGGRPRGVLLGAPEPTGDRAISHRLLATAKIEARIARIREDEDRGWPFSDDPSVIFLINERVSPRPLRWRDSPLWLGIVASLLLHVLIFSQLLQGSFTSQLVAMAREAYARRHFPDDNTPFYELVEKPNDRKETPTNPRAPLSDLDRRAHGGVGKPATRPGSEGNTPELRISPPGGGGSQVADAGASRDTGGDKGAGKGSGPSPENGSGQDTRKDDQVGAADALVLPKGGSGSRGGLDLRALSARGPGALGGTMPMRKGGQVDVGPLAFDTTWYDWGPYASEMLRRIRYHWNIPEIAQMGVGGVVRIHFFIERDGRVTDVVVERGSGHPPMDFAARDAILNASPLPPLPPDLTGVDHEGVTITFYYNTPVPEGEYTG